MKRKIVSRKKPTAARLRTFKALIASCDRVLKVLRRRFKAALA